jgi:hypothetical protein
VTESIVAANSRFVVLKEMHLIHACREALRRRINRVGTRASVEHPVHIVPIACYQGVAKAKFFPHDLGEQVRVGVAGAPIDVVVRSHERTAACLCKGFPRLEIDVTQRTHAYLRQKTRHRLFDPDKAGLPRQARDKHPERLKTGKSGIDCFNEFSCTSTGAPSFDEPPYAPKCFASATICPTGR